MHHFALLLLLVVTVGYTSGYYLVAAPVGTCTNKRAYGIMFIRRGQCATMGGRWKGSAGYKQWTDCYMDWCDIPLSGAVSSGYAWGVDTDQSHRRFSSTHTYGSFILERDECDRIYGRYNGNSKAGDWINCFVYMKRMDGTSRRKMDSIIFAGDGQCSKKVARGTIRMTHRECIQNGGKWTGNPGSKDWIRCQFDLCVSPVIDCEPSDLWSTIQVCRNPSSSSFTCSFEMRVGIEKGTRTDSKIGAHVSEEITSEITAGLTAGITAQITPEVSGSLMGTFAAKQSTKLSTGYHWEHAVSLSSLWSAAATRTMEVKLDPGKSVAINQVVGVCGDYRVDTTEYRVVDVTNKK